MTRHVSAWRRISGCVLILTVSAGAVWGGGQPFRRGDANADGNADISDGIGVLNFLFLGAEEPPCFDAADTNDDGAIDLSDGVAVFNFLFTGGPPPAAPGPFECGVDPTGDDPLGCESFPPCPAAPDATEAILAARAGDDGQAEIEIDGAVVSYLRPAVGSAPAGFFVQATPTGPAILVEVDPVELDPAPQPGDVVRFTATELGTIFGAQTITALSGFDVLESGLDLEPWVQDLTSASDVVEALDEYESELIAVEATQVVDFGGAGSGHVSAEIATSAVSGTSDLRLRIPSSLADFLDVELEYGAGCSFSLVGPMWRFNQQAQPSAYYEEDIVVLACPAPRVTGAEATSSFEVVVRLDRTVLPSSLVAPSEQFAFEPALSVLDAEAQGREIVLTTGEHEPLVAYTVTVAGVTDTLGVEVDPTASSAMFTALPVGLAISEVDYAVIAHGGALVITGAGFASASEVTIGGVAVDFVIGSDSEITLPIVGDEVPVGEQALVVDTPSGSTEPFSVTVVHLVLGEVDADQTGTDIAEFVEVSAGVAGVDLTGYSIVLFNGNGDSAYTVVELASATDEAGLLWVGTPAVVPAPQITFAAADNAVQNGADAVALAQGDEESLAIGVLAFEVVALDALVYGTSDPDDVELLEAFGLEAQVDENLNGLKDTQSMQRCSDARLDSSAWVVVEPTTGAENACVSIAE